MSFGRDVLEALPELRRSVDTGVSNDLKLDLLVQSIRAAELERETDPTRKELRFWSDQVERYRRILLELRRHVRGVRALKGPAIADLYPAGWLRTFVDLDIVVPSLACVWQAAETLQEAGWQHKELAMVILDGSPELVASFVAESPCPEALAVQRVEIATLELLGDPRSCAPRKQLPACQVPDVLQLVALLQEGFERAFTLRDALDYSLLTHRHSEEAWLEVERTIRTLDLLPNLLALEERLIVACGGRPGDRSHLIRLAARDSGAAPSQGGDFTHLHGVPIDDRASGRLVFDRTAAHLLARMPLGTFLMTPSSAVDASALTVARRASSQWET